MHAVTFSGPQLPDLKVGSQLLAGRAACGYDERGFKENPTVHIHTLGLQKNWRWSTEPLALGYNETKPEVLSIE